MPTDKITRMANQIATFFESQPEPSAKEIAKHINDFWEPRMRSQLASRIDAGGAGLHPAVIEAAPHIRKPPKD